MKTINTSAAERLDWIDNARYALEQCQRFQEAFTKDKSAHPADFMRQGDIKMALNDLDLLSASIRRSLWRG